MVNFGLLAAEIGLPVWGTPANFNGFRVLAALLHGLSTSGRHPNFAALNRGRHLCSQGGHHVGHWPTFLVNDYISCQLTLFRKSLAAAYILTDEYVQLSIFSHQVQFSATDRET